MKKENSLIFGDLLEELLLNTAQMKLFPQEQPLNQQLLHRPPITQVFLAKQFDQHWVRSE